MHYYMLVIIDSLSNINFAKTFSNPSSESLNNDGDIVFNVAFFNIDIPLYSNLTNLDNFTNQKIIHF